MIPLELVSVEAQITTGRSGNHRGRYEDGNGARVQTCTAGDMRAHAHSLMRVFLTFPHVPLENIDESPFKNNSCLVGSLNDLQLFHQHVIIAFITWGCADQGCCATPGRPLASNRRHLKFILLQHARLASRREALMWLSQEHLLKPKRAALLRRPSEQPCFSSSVCCRRKSRRHFQMQDI